MAESVYPKNKTRFPAYSEPGGGPPLHEPRYHSNVAPVGRTETRSNLALSDAAERVGNAVGSAVEKVRELPERLQQMKERFTVIRGRTQEDLSTKAGEIADDLKQQAQLTVTRARTRARYIAREHPRAVILGAAVVGMVLGIVLRVWRDHAD